MLLKATLLMTVSLFSCDQISWQLFSPSVAVDTLKARVTKKKGRGFGGRPLWRYRSCNWCALFGTFQTRALVFKENLRL